MLMRESEEKIGKKRGKDDVWSASRTGIGFCFGLVSHDEIEDRSVAAPLEGTSLNNQVEQEEKNTPCWTGFDPLLQR
jgi:hypothetical protein